MPLVKGMKASTRKGFSSNVKHEMKEEGKPQKQAVAIAYSEARRGKRKAHGMTANRSGRGYRK